MGLSRTIGADDDKCHGTGEKSCNTAVAHQTFINTYMKLQSAKMTTAVMAMAAVMILSASLWAWECLINVADHATNSSSPAPATKVDMEEGCITAKAADIPIKKCVLPSMLRFGPYLMFYLQFSQLFTILGISSIVSYPCLKIK